MTTNSRIVLDPDVLAGKPIIEGTRLSVEFIVGLLADGWDEGDILKNYPGITREDILACLTYARDVLNGERTANHGAQICAAPIALVPTPR